LPLETLDLGVQFVELLLLGEGGGGEAIRFGLKKLGEPADASESIHLFLDLNLHGGLS
jgi:hypothetical protein